jgi:hypothetical protein
MTGISGLIICKDAARFLPAVAANVRRAAQELVIVADPASTDSTVAVAQGLADTCAVWDTQGVPEQVLNRAVLELCHLAWVLRVDDDELLPPTFCAHLPPLLADEGAAEYGFPRKHLIGTGERWIVSEPWYPDWQIRLRRRAAYSTNPWPTECHQVGLDYKRRWVQLPFWHLKFCIKTYRQRADRMLDWAAIWPYARSDHYRRFSLPESYDYQTAPIDEEAPVEWAALWAAAQPEGHDG